MPRTKKSLRVELVEQVEDRGGLALERTAALVPVVPAERAVDELVPVLEVEAEQELGHRLNPRRSLATPTSEAEGGQPARPPQYRAREAARSHHPRRRAARRGGDIFAVTEHLKLEDSPVIRTTFAARFSPKLVEERIGFRLRREEDISLDIADSNGRIVKHAVGSGVFGPAYHQFAWDGRDDSGPDRPDGTYRVQLTLKDENRTIEFPNSITVDSTPPTIEVDLQHQVFSTGRRRAGGPRRHPLRVRRAGVGDPLRERQADRDHLPEEADRYLPLVREGQEAGRVSPCARRSGPRGQQHVDA